MFDDIDWLLFTFLVFSPTDSVPVRMFILNMTKHPNNVQIISVRKKLMVQTVIKIQCQSGFFLNS